MKYKTGKLEQYITTTVLAFSSKILRVRLQGRGQKQAAPPDSGSSALFVRVTNPYKKIPYSPISKPTSDDPNKCDSGVEVVLHDEKLLADEECADGGEGHVGAANASLVVESGEPLLGENSHAHGRGINGTNSEVKDLEMKF